MASELNSTIDPIALTRDLVRCPSVTPNDAGALDVLEHALTGLGFKCTRLPFSEPGTPDVDNLYARLGTDGRHFCFAGHTDVVPIGTEAAWSVDPFGGEVINGALFGRGATDMKGAIAAFVAAVDRFKQTNEDFGSISFLITGDEEGPAINGTRKMLEWLNRQNEIPNQCLVGEPTNPHILGEMIKIGRRGSLNAKLTIHGAQGHVAYPDLADNPMPRLLHCLQYLTNHVLDEGTEYFQPSRLEVVTIDTGNSATNVIPGRVEVGFNIRFNNLHTEQSLVDWLTSELDDMQDSLGGSFTLEAKASGEAFITEPNNFTDIIVTAVEEVCGAKPELSTSGGTSDARFITNYCPVAELGLISQSMHKTDEHVQIQDLHNLSSIYENILTRYFSDNQESK